MSTTNVPVVILVSGAPVRVKHSLIPDGALVIAADGGMRQAQHLGIDVDLLIGDMDSIDPEVLTKAAGSGTEIRRHPRDKDATDLELAFDAAVSAGATEIQVIGGGGGRLDHFIGNAMLIAKRAIAGVRIAWGTGTELVTVALADIPATVEGAAGDWLSLIPVGGPASGITVRGVKWELEKEKLEVGSTRGISNVLLSDTAEVSIRSGTLLVVHTKGDIR